MFRVFVLVTLVMSFSACRDTEEKCKLGGAIASVERTLERARDRGDHLCAARAALQLAKNGKERDFHRLERLAPIALQTSLDCDLLDGWSALRAARGLDEQVLWNKYRRRIEHDKSAAMMRCRANIREKNDVGSKSTFAEKCRVEPPSLFAAESSSSHGLRIVFASNGGSFVEERRPNQLILRSTRPCVLSSRCAQPNLAEGGVESLSCSMDGDRAQIVLNLFPEAQFSSLHTSSKSIVDVRQKLGNTKVTTIVLDPGHGGNEFGARHGGMRESHLVLDIAQRVATRLKVAMPDAQVLMTRHDDSPRSLESRAAYANAVDADIFVSIHLNAADEVVRKGGVTTFVLDTSDSKQALKLAARENGQAMGDVSEISKLLASVSRADQVNASAALAASVHQRTLAAGRTHLPKLDDRGVKSALFYVLVGATMPAVLVEASFMSHPPELEALRTERYRTKLANGIAFGIADYLQSR